MATILTEKCNVMIQNRLMNKRKPWSFKKICLVVIGIINICTLYQTDICNILCKEYMFVLALSEIKLLYLFFQSKSYRWYFIAGKYDGAVDCSYMRKSNTCGAAIKIESYTLNIVASHYVQIRPGLNHNDSEKLMIALD